MNTWLFIKANAEGWSYRYRPLVNIHNNASLRHFPLALFYRPGRSFILPVTTPIFFSRYLKCYPTNQRGKSFHFFLMFFTLCMFSFRTSMNLLSGLPFSLLQLTSIPFLIHPNLLHILSNSTFLSSQPITNKWGIFYLQCKSLFSLAAVMLIKKQEKMFHFSPPNKSRKNLLVYFQLMLMWCNSIIIQRVNET